MCLYSHPIKNRKYTKTKKNGGLVPPLVDRRLEWVQTKCGKCIECRKQYANEWRVRLLEHTKTNNNGKFLTLTFSNDSIQEIIHKTIKKTNKENGNIEKITIATLHGYAKDNAIATVGVRQFNESWRNKHKRAPKHWLITELGHEGTENIHLHGIIWTNQTYDEIRDKWKWGWIYPRNKQEEEENYVTLRTINYCIKYVTKIDKDHKEYRPIILSSTGIGKDFLKTEQANKIETQLIETYKTTTGHTVTLPKYYKDKLISEEDRERLWIQKLDKEEKWICGIKIKTTDQETINNITQHFRRKNAELGYGQRTNENRKEHEELKREALLKIRLQNTNASGGV